MFSFKSHLSQLKCKIKPNKSYFNDQKFLMNISLTYSKNNNYYFLKKNYAFLLFKYELFLFQTAEKIWITNLPHSSQFLMKIVVGTSKKIRINTPQDLKPSTHLILVLS